MTFLRALFVQTIVAPDNAARVIAGMNLSREAGWMALLLAAILNTLIYFTNIALVPVPDDFWVPIIRTPLTYLVASFSLTVVLVFALFWAGQMLKGQARLPVLVSLVAWLFCVQSAADLLFVALFLFVPMLAGVFSLAAGLYGIWILINFITVAQGFPDRGKAVMTIVLALMGLVVGLSLFLSVTGLTAMGIR
ncbi:Yip1 family protein [uncultured Shimia sp.]|uniref:Yip1 family protein n=1 Tax=uncultured Shimia sp. TaxID=573152 RepID=UPI002601A7BB|nr:Yip1 family protein [uncultured Shimia sp.]